jgi:protein-S-isoprenylcysteine O-methyltransferase Ste14
MYLAGLLMILGPALVFGSIPLLEYAALYWFVVHLFVVIYEEPTLKRSFGASYSDYRSKVRRWLPGGAFQPADGT